MQILDQQQYAALIAPATLLVGTPQKPKVMLSQTQQIIKFFWCNKRISSARLRPYALRFVNNAQRLAAKELPTLCVDKLYHIPQKNLHIVTYDKLPGEDIRAAIYADDSALMTAFIDFYASLHQRGILFRGIHLGNVLKLSTGEFSLIDFVGLKIFPKPLTGWQRARNFKHLLLDRNDKAFFSAYGQQRFIDQYCASAQLTPAKEAYLRFLLKFTL